MTAYQHRRTIGLAQLGIGAGSAFIFGMMAADMAGAGKPELKPEEPPRRVLNDDTLDGIEKEIAALPVSYKTSDFSDDTNEVLLARMIFGEARNCSETEMAGVAYTAVNRTNDGKKWNGTTLREVLLKPWQYSCFNENDPNRQRLMDPERFDSVSFERCLGVAGRVLSGEIEDPTKGATHYFNPNSANPSWAKKLRKVGRISTESGTSRHEFYMANR